MTKSSLIVTTFLLCACLPASAQQPAVQKFLQEGKLADGAAAMQKKLDTNADDAEAGFSLGVIQFFQAVEGLGQDQYRYGLLGGRRRQLPMMRLPVPENDSPEQISYAKARKIVENFLDRLTKAEATLAKVKPSGVKLPLKVGQVRLDLNGDGVGTDEESLLEVMNAIMSGGGATVDESVNQLVIAFDDGDVLWLRGYCHVMSACVKWSSPMTGRISSNERLICSIPTSKRPISIWSMKASGRSAALTRRTFWMSSR